MATKRLMGGEHLQHGYKGQRNDSRSGWREVGWHKISSRYRMARHLKTYTLFISGILHLIFLECGMTTGNRLWKAKPWIREGCCTSSNRMPTSFKTHHYATLKRIISASHNDMIPWRGVQMWKPVHLRICEICLFVYCPPFSTRIEAPWKQGLTDYCLIPIPRSWVFNKDALKWNEHPPWGKYCYYLHCADVNNWGTERSSNWHKITQPGSPWITFRPFSTHYSQSHDLYSVSPSSFKAASISFYLV